MKTRLRRHLLLAAALVAASAVVSARAYAQADDPLNSLPTSDAVIFLDMHRIVTEIAPRLLAKDPATLAKIMGQLNEVRTKTGFNVLGIERIAAGVQLLAPAKPGMKKENIGICVILRGDFDANALVEFARRDGKGKAVEETYGGKVIISEPRPAPPRVKNEREVAALTVLDPTTIVVGDLPQVRAAIDAAGGKGRVDPTLVQLAERDSTAILGLAGNVPPDLIQGIRANAPKDEMAQSVIKLIENIRQVFSSIGSTPTDFNLVGGFRFTAPEQAQTALDMLLGIRQKVTEQVPDPQAREILNSLQISADGDALQIKIGVKNEVVQGLLADMMKEESKPAATATKPTPANKPRKPRRARRRTRR